MGAWLQNLRLVHYFAEYLTSMLTLGLRSYRCSNLVLDLKMWENFESNLQVFQGERVIQIDQPLLDL